MTRQEENMLISKVILYNDHRAFEKLITIHQNGIKNLLMKLLDFNGSDVDDLYQESCTKIYRNIKQFKGKSRFSTWVYRITYNTFLNAHERKMRFKEIKEEFPKMKSVRTDSMHDMKIDVERMISILRPEEKAAIQLSYILGFSHKDIAHIMDCPVGTVKSLIKRGKDKLVNNFKYY